MPTLAAVLSQLFPDFDQSAREHPDACFIAVDVNISPQIATRLDVRCIPDVVTMRDGMRMERHCGPTTAMAVDEIVLKLHKRPSHRGRSVGDGQQWLV